MYFLVHEFWFQIVHNYIWSIMFSIKHAMYVEACA
jgi:hypothetical protein